MEDEIDITPRAVAQVMWKYFYILKSWAAARGLAEVPILRSRAKIT
jgi:hypothetical protein